MMKQPNISVVIPVYNGDHLIQMCLESLFAMDYPNDRIEVIAVDNNSTDNTRQVINRFPVVALTEETQGPSAARNAGIAASKAGIIAFTDMDCVVDRNWALVIEQSFNNESVDAILGFAAGINANLFAELAQKRWESFWFEKTNSGLVLKHPGIDTRNCAIRKCVLDQTGGFNEKLLHCEDLELSMRLNLGGYRIIDNQEMRVSHRNPTTLEVALKKSRERMAALLDLRRNPPAGFSMKDLPLPSSAFFGIADRELSRPALWTMIVLLQAALFLILNIIRLLLALRVRSYLTFKLYKLFHGIGYDLAILRDRRARH